MIRPSLYTLFFLVSIIEANAQKETYIWYFGYNAGLDFNPGAPVAINSGMLSTNEGCSGICDANGNLLFYTDGSTVWNKNHFVMPVGTGMGGHFSTTQAALIIPQPGNDSIYYLFTNAHCEDLSSPPGFQYSLINMNLDGGNGDIASGPTDLSVGINERITSVRHANGNDIWIITNKGSVFYAFLLSATGINTTPVLSNLGPVLNCHGHLKTSSNGKKIAVAAENRGMVYDFNQTTGILSNPIIISNISPYGGEFSPDGSKLYLSGWGPSKVYQYDLNAGNELAINNSITEVGESNGSYSFGAFQLGPDQRIYITAENSPYLDIIHNPNATGLLCNFEDDALYLNSRLGALGLPNMFHGFLEPEFTWLYSCSWEPTYFTLSDTSGMQSVNWNFGDVTSGLTNTSTDFFPSHIYSSAGTYSVTLITNYGTYSDTIIQSVTISYTDGLCETEDQEFLPSAFSPNGDDVNDILYVRGNNITSVTWYVYDRWGQAVFQGSSQADGWDGKINGKIVNAGTFAYKLNLKLKSGTEKLVSGKLVIVK